MTWVFKKTERLQYEISEIEVLQKNVDWLISAKPSLANNFGFKIEFEICVKDKNYPFTLSYPNFFPETPPSVFPSDNRVYSKHQWGNGGELCLEYRPDNWDPKITGAKLIESTFRLISSELLEENERPLLPDAHEVSLGRDFRGKSFRFFPTTGLQNYLKTLERGIIYKANLAERSKNLVFTAFLSHFGSETSPTWQEDLIAFEGYRISRCTVLILNSLDHIKISEKSDLDNIINSYKADDIRLSESDEIGYTILADENGAKLYCTYFSNQEWNIITYETFDLLKEDDARLPSDFDLLDSQKVGIVGCGSLGSKIAASLARSGIRNFLLIDDDVLTPGNLVRNELSFEHIGRHKVEALAERLKNLAPGVEVEFLRIRLGGQESSGIMSRALNALATCHLLIDGTANPTAFNLVSSIAIQASCIMLWAEIYAGGIGGFIARVRPDIEPTPHSAREQYLSWCADQGVSFVNNGQDYSLQQDALPPVIADDASVGIVAAHLVRMAIDSLIQNNNSAFPYPAYLIGFTKGWIFEEPFDTRPIIFHSNGKWNPPLSDEQGIAAVECLSSLLEELDNENRTSA